MDAKFRQAVELDGIRQQIMRNELLKDESEPTLYTRRISYSAKDSYAFNLSNVEIAAIRLLLTALDAAENVTFLENDRDYIIDALKGEIARILWSA